MELYFEMKMRLEERGYNNVGMIAGGKLLVGISPNQELCLFDVKGNPIVSDLVKVQKEMMPHQNYSAANGECQRSKNGGSCSIDAPGLG